MSGVSEKCTTCGAIFKPINDHQWTCDQCLNSMLRTSGILVDAIKFYESEHDWKKVAELYKQLFELNDKGKND